MLGLQQLHPHKHGSIVGFIATDTDGIIGAFYVKDTIREEAKDAQIDVIICTGDNNLATHAATIAKEIGIP
jgi:cation transport ATPase